MVLVDAVAPFLNFCKVERQNSKQTLEKYEEVLRCWIIPQLGGKDLSVLTRLDVTELRRVMMDKGLSSARQYSVVMTLKTFLGFCRQVLKTAALDPAELSLPSRGKPHVVTLTKDDLKAVFDQIPINNFSGARLRALIELLLATGMRISEALSLNRDVFDVKADRVEIKGKGGKYRVIFFNERCHFWVKHYLEKRHDPEEALFVTTGFTPRRLARADISRFFVNLKEKVGLQKKFTPHILRHTYCTNLLNNGADIMFIKQLAGHEDIQTTAKYYLGVDNEQLRKVVDKHLSY